MYTQTRGGTRGGAAEFKWSDVGADKDREHYLGHSINAPTGRWQKNKDIHWYNRDKKSTEEEKLEEIRKIKEAEEEALALALGLPPGTRLAKPGEPSDTKSPEEKEEEATKKALEKEEKRKRKEEKRLRKEERRERREHRREDRPRAEDSDEDDLRDRRPRRRSPPRFPPSPPPRERHAVPLRRSPSPPRRSRSPPARYRRDYHEERPSDRRRTYERVTEYRRDYGERRRSRSID